MVVIVAFRLLSSLFVGFVAVSLDWQCLTYRTASIIWLITLGPTMQIIWYVVYIGCTWDAIKWMLEFQNSGRFTQHIYGEAVPLAILRSCVSKALKKRQSYC